MKERVLTEHQKAFLDALAGDSRGNLALAKKMAGYSDHVKVSEIISSLRAEVVNIAMNTLASIAPKAAFALDSTLDDPTQAGATTKIKAAQEILNRAGATAPQESVQLNVPRGGLFIMPAKGAGSTEAKDTEEKNDEEG